MDTVTITGLKELNDRLRSLANAVGEKNALKPVSASLRKAGVILQKAIQQNLRAGGHVKSGTLVNNIVIYKKRGPDSTVSYGVSIRAKAKKYKDTSRNISSGKAGGVYKDYGPLFYARFLEFGTSHQPSTPFMRPAFEQHKGELPEVFRNELSKRLDAIK